MPKKYHFEYQYERRWELGYLKRKCVELGVEKEYVLYLLRLRINNLGIFLMLHNLLTMFYCALLLLKCEHLQHVYIDIMANIAVAVVVTIILIINLNDEFVLDNIWILYVTSILSSLIIIVVDLFLKLYHYYNNGIQLGTFYDTYIIYVIYMFMPIPFILPPFILGSIISFVYICYFIIYLSSSYHYNLLNPISYYSISLDVSHFICINLFGCFYRVMNEIFIRSSLIDRHQYIVEEIKLRHAREHEMALLHSILPPQISRPIQNDIRSRIALMKLGVNLRESSATTQLQVDTLVALLHNLYARFDLAASRYNVQRIKFLGDCYYCVAGLTKTNPDHAKCCVDLALCMIREIREVRSEHNLEIDMRIGVHSGELFAGVIGEVKLQYDIWGTDVTIANKLESTGIPGYVHISENTLNMLNEEYTVEPGPKEALNDPYLNKYIVNTYLVQSTMDDKHVTVTFKVSDSDKNVIKKYSIYELSLGWSDEFKNMPVGGVPFIRYRNASADEIKFNQSTNFLCLTFRSPRLEWKYIRQPDYMIKNSVLFSWFVGVSIIYIHIFTSNSSLSYFYIIDIAILLGLTALVTLLWYKKCCVWMYGDKAETHAYKNWSIYMLKTADMIQSSLALRMTIYVCIILSYFVVLSVLLMDCDREEYEILHIESKLFNYELDMSKCFHSWVLTNAVVLFIGMTFIFSRMPFLVKTCIGIIETVSYLVLVFYEFEYIVHHSLTTNPYFYAEYAHALLVLMTLASVYLMERQIETNSKINYNWRVELKKKQNAASITNESIKVLLNNILPTHVVSVYLTSLASHKLYYEDYKTVSVMFATIKNFNMSLPSLRVLNDIVSEFDKIVEKIKVVGCTYMAACGLGPNFARRISIVPGSDDTLQSEENQLIHPSGTSIEQEDNIEEVVIVLTTFAIDLMRALWTFNQYHEDIAYERTLSSDDISIGISSGVVMAGVVGACQPHYDIWGDPVNMASRMDSTGVIGKIQVTEESALILRGYGVECTYRGLTKVKGRNIIPTYFVSIDENFYFKRNLETSPRMPQFKEAYKGFKD